MPHINIKCYPGRTEENVPQEKWDEEVWDKDIEPQKNYLYKKPGYTKE